MLNIDSTTFFRWTQCGTVRERRWLLPLRLVWKCTAAALVAGALLGGGLLDPVASSARAGSGAPGGDSGVDPAAESAPVQPAAKPAKASPPFAARIPAPTLDGGIAWLNTEKPLSIEQLRGKFVLLDFWTYCCINCIHVLPELKRLERAYPNELVVIGVHSAKFEGEKETDNIREAILRYEIEHPVVNDAQMTIWDRYNVQSWPSMALIDPDGQLVGITSGEKTFEQLNQLMQFALPYYREKGLIDRTPLRFALERDKLEPQPLLFPGKLLADEKTGRLFIADSNHNRIVIVGLDGKLETVIGSGLIGRQDGTFSKATFHHPQGMALAGQTLYVADTENHLIRKVDLASKQVATVAGIGTQARGPWLAGSPDDDGQPKIAASGPPAETALNSPWAVLVHENRLYIAMAGPHQIWRMPLDESRIEIYAGNGREDIVDGRLLPPVPYETGYSSFAQPSGLASDGQWLYVADTEGSSIRAVPFDSSQVVETVIGTSQLPGGRLFVFGDRDGQGLVQIQTSRLAFRAEPEQTTGPLLQHAIGIAYQNGKLYVADTYNNKIKVIDPVAKSCRTLAGTGEPGHDDGLAASASFDEPAGLSVAGGKLYVADTNNHRIRVVDLERESSVSTLTIQGLEPPVVP
jgi:thiol-disulfide isomerase/thioredoxin